MKNFKNTRIAVAMLCAALFTTTPLLAQEWSAAQKEVWRNVVIYWALWADRDLEGFLEYFHPDFIGWSYDSALPQDTSSRRKWLDHSMETNEILVYEINPVAIQVHDKFAIVHYYYALKYEDYDGYEHSNQGRWTDILMKQGKKWVMISDHGGSTTND